MPLEALIMENCGFSFSIFMFHAPNDLHSSENLKRCYEACFMDTFLSLIHRWLLSICSLHLATLLAHRRQSTALLGTHTLTCMEFFIDSRVTPVTPTKSRPTVKHQTCQGSQAKVGSGWKWWMPNRSISKQIVPSAAVISIQCTSWHLHKDYEATG